MYTDLYLEFERLHPECTDYNVLDDSRRSVHHGNGTEEATKPWKCDSSESPWKLLTSPDWVGAGWYRMMAGTNTKIPVSPPGTWYCGTYTTGWLKGSHPSVAGQTRVVKFCFDYRGRTFTDCHWSTQGKVTHCGEYFVYYLENTSKCPLRYCATDSF